MAIQLSVAHFSAANSQAIRELHESSVNGFSVAERRVDTTLLQKSHSCRSRTQALPCRGASLRWECFGQLQALLMQIPPWQDDGTKRFWTRFASTFQHRRSTHAIFTTLPQQCTTPGPRSTIRQPGDFIPPNTSLETSQPLATRPLVRCLPAAFAALHTLHGSDCDIGNARTGTNGTWFQLVIPYVEQGNLDAAYKAWLKEYKAFGVGYAELYSINEEPAKAPVPVFSCPSDMNNGKNRTFGFYGNYVLNHGSDLLMRQCVAVRRSLII